MMNFWIKASLCLSLLALPLVAGAQKAPDNDEIFGKTIDGASPFHYPSLKMRYDAGDTTLTTEDYHYLYYGYAFRDEYAPLHVIPAEEKLLAVFGEGEEPDYEGMLRIIEYGTEIMKTDPFSPRNLNYLTYAYGAIGDTLNERIFNDRFEKVLRVIEASGNGLKEETPKHVLRFEHAADVINSRGLAIRQRMIVSRTVEYVDLQQKDGKTKGYYFDFSRVYWNRPEQTPEKQRGFKPYTPPTKAPVSGNRNY